MPPAAPSRSACGVHGRDNGSLGRPVIAGGWAHAGRRDLAHILRPEIRVALKLVPGLMERELRDLVNLIATLEQAAGGFVPQIVETQILDPEHVAGAREGGPHALGVIREDVLCGLRLCLDDRPRLRRGERSPFQYGAESRLYTAWFRQIACELGYRPRYPQRRHSILVAYMSPLQLLNSPEYAEIAQKCRTWKPLQK